MDAAPLISLVLATLGRQQELQPLLRSLREQTERRFELVLVDQNVQRLPPRLLQPLRDQGVPVRHLHVQPRGLSAARNLGLQEATGRWVAFPDDDGWYDADTLSAAMAALDGASPALDGLLAWWVEAQPQGPQHLGALDATAWRRFRGGEASSITQFLRTGAVRRWGGFDERLGLGAWYAAGEETDLVLRALEAGARLAHVGSVRVHHPPPGPSRQTLVQRVARARGTGALYAKHAMAVPVVARGLLSPWFKGRPAIGWGRLQGWAGWHLGLQRSAG